jgi:hypothetical protein
MKYFSLVFVFALITLTSNAQPGKTTLEVDKRFHDFGKIKEDGGKVRALFTFKNTGSKNLIILNAEPSCGCTVGEWTKDSIAPGKTGTVTAIFDPKNMIGIIDKTVGVYTNAAYSTVIVLELRGEVVPRDKSLSDVFPYRVGNLMFDKEMMELGEVPHNAADSAYIVMYNDGQYPIKINNITPLPKGFRIRPEKNVIQPSEEVRLYASMDAFAINDFGPFNKTFRLITDDPEYNEKPLFLFGHIKYNFGRMTKKELKAAPKFTIDITEKDFGEKQVGSQAYASFKISNKGKNDLKILAVKAQCSCTEPSLNKTELKTGESAILMIKFDMLGHAGTIQKVITIYTNDPSKPTFDVMVRAKLY